MHLPLGGLWILDLQDILCSKKCTIKFDIQTHEQAILFQSIVNNLSYGNAVYVHILLKQIEMILSLPHGRLN